MTEHWDATDREIARYLASEPVRASSRRTYRESLRYVWNPWAEANGYPTDFTAAPLEMTAIRAFFVACLRGETRQRPRPDEVSRPLAPISVDCVLAALRRAHLDAGQPWIGDGEGKNALRLLRKGYAKEAARPVRKARPARSDTLHQLFDAPPAPRSSHDLLNTILVLLGVDHGLTPEELRATAVVVRTTTKIEARTPLREVVIACYGHRPSPGLPELCCACLLREWASSYGEPGAGAPGDVVVVRFSADAVRRHAYSAAPEKEEMGLRNRGDFDAFRVVRAGYPGLVVWLRTRAMMLLSASLGVRPDTLAQMRLENSTATSEGFSVRVTSTKNRYDRAGEVYSWKAVGGPLCPVTAVTAWLDVRRLAGQEGQIFTPVGRDGCPTAIPVSSRNVYQALRKALRRLCVELGVERLSPGSGRTTYATGAFALGVAPEVVKRTMRHRKYKDTLGYGSANGARHAAETLMRGLCERVDDSDV